MRGQIQSAVNMLVMSVCLLMLTALLLPTIVRQRGDARESACSNNMKQLGLAIHNYHSAYKQLPPGAGGTTGGLTPEESNEGRLGPLVGLLPFVEQQALWEQIANPYQNEKTNQTFPPMGPVPWYDEKAYLPWGRSPIVYTCPANAGAPGEEDEPKIVYTLESKAGGNLLTNYVACYGDGTLNIGEPWGEDRETVQQSMASKRGMFAAGRAFKFRDVLDGLSNTIMMSETRASLLGERDNSGIVKNVKGLSTDPSLCLAAAEKPGAAWWDVGRGSRWCDGALPIAGFQTVLPPNSQSCASENGLLDAIASASSDHTDGVMVLFADGAVVLMTDSVDAGDSTSPGVAIDEGYVQPGSESPYGLWGALGSRASAEDARNRLVNTRPVEASLQRDRGHFTTWYDKNAKVALSAEFVRIIDRKTVELKDSAGVLHRVPLNTLRDTDLYRAVQMQVIQDAQ